MLTWPTSASRVRTVRRTLSLTEHCEWARPGQRVDEAARDERVDERAQLRVGLRDLHDAAEGAGGGATEIRKSRVSDEPGYARGTARRAARGAAGPRRLTSGSAPRRGPRWRGRRRHAEDGCGRGVDLCQSYVARDDDKLRCHEKASAASLRADALLLTIFRVVCWKLVERLIFNFLHFHPHGPGFGARLRPGFQCHVPPTSGRLDIVQAGRFADALRSCRPGA